MPTARGRLDSRRSLLPFTIVLLLANLRLDDVSARSFGQRFGGRVSFSAFPNHQTTRSDILTMRGGGSGGSIKAQKNDSSHDTVAAKERAYRLQQQLYLQTRSLLLREALIHRGFVELHHYDQTGVTRPKEVDWDCMVSTAEHPKQCIYTFATEVGTKVLCPVDVDVKKYITVASLNQLRRADPTKVNPLWNNQYNVLDGWFGETSKYSVYRHLPPAFALGVSGLLDRPWLLQTVFGLTVVFGMIFTLPAWRILGPQLLQMPLLWQTWSHWYRFVHAALPLKLIMFQYALYYGGEAAKSIYSQIRDYLVEWECRMLEDCLPLTVIEGDDDEEDVDVEED
jgi:hypothetical protein